TSYESSTNLKVYIFLVKLHIFIFIKFNKSNPFKQSYFFCRIIHAYSQFTDVRHIPPEKCPQLTQRSGSNTTVTLWRLRIKMNDPQYFFIHFPLYITHFFFFIQNDIHPDISQIHRLIELKLYIMYIFLIQIQVIKALLADRPVLFSCSMHEAGAFIQIPRPLILCIHLQVEMIK